jgi:DNA primase
VIEAAKEMRTRLEALGLLEPHARVRRQVRPGCDQVLPVVVWDGRKPRPLPRASARTWPTMPPDKYLINMSKKQRTGRIFSTISAMIARRPRRCRCHREHGRARPSRCR